jgi:DNA-binding CsgD family transcriptional regulator
VSDLVSVVERAYDLDSDTETWLAGILEAAQPLLDSGFGLVGYAFDAKAEHLSAPVIVSRGVDSDSIEATARLLMNAPKAMVDRTYLSSRVVATASEATGLGEKLAEFEPWMRYAAPLGMVDNLGIKARGQDPGQGCMLHAIRDTICRTSRTERRLWERIAAHISAGLRLRWALERGAEASRGQSEAILRPDGQLAHAESAAEPPSRRDVLRDAVKRLERARGATRRTEPEVALELWRGLVAGRWTLIDQYEENGRRYLVARRNDPEHLDPRALTPRERQVAHLVAQGQSNKLIAYTLGLSLSTVGTHIAAAKRKLGVSSRSELIALVIGGAGGGK